MDIEAARKWDRERKRKSRELGDDYSKKQKEAKRKYILKYRKTKQGTVKDLARRAAYNALKSGALVRPTRCQKCGGLGKVLLDGRSGLRMDHHKGYAKENWTNVIFICVMCDGEQLRKG